MRDSISYPRLRPVDFRPIVRNGRWYVAVRDPLRLSDQTLMVPQALAPALALCDGTRDLRAIRAALMVRYGIRLDEETLRSLIDALDELYLLENERFREAKARALEIYRRASFRPPMLAESVYPGDPGQLQRLIHWFEEEASEEDSIVDGRGLLSPHIDYARGGRVYARVWRRAAPFVREADLAVILGTDHYGEDRSITLTRQHYATPFGVLPTALPVVNALGEALGEEVAFDGELRHRGEHSIELAAVWLHATREGKSIELVPVLCGPFASFMQGDQDPMSDPMIARFVEALRAAIAGRRAVIIAAGDLAHVGPAFGDRPLDLTGRARLKADDQVLIDRMAAGDAAGFFEEIRQIRDRNQVCGVSPIYLALRTLEPTVGEKVDYELCPADEQGTSVVSICGLVWR
ncbi:MAG: AmmeMemoRadiSam system protein B [Anaerolineae bacterium]|nr:AmmeMemoRadiSam system protein B [Thermoflexus sp.]MDW8065445.1 AmmeMemoRadiSam system protein B [Anaerolineae bacterium]